MAEAMSSDSTSTNTTPALTVANSAPTEVSAVVFDWAGTTIDYGCFAPVQAFRQIFVTRGIEPTDSEVRAPMGQAKRDHIVAMLSGKRLSELWREQYGRAWTQADIDELYGVYEDILLASLSDFCDVKPGVLETVAALRTRGIKLGSTTGYTAEMMHIVCAGAAANGYAPDEMVTPGDVGFGRPWPFMLFENMRRLQMAAVDCVIKVGDTLADIAEGKNAGVYTVGVVEGSSEMGLHQAEYEALSASERVHRSTIVRERYLAAGADAVVQTFSHLLLLFTNLSP